MLYTIIAVLSGLPFGLGVDALYAALLVCCSLHVPFEGVLMLFPVKHKDVRGLLFIPLHLSNDWDTWSPN